MTTVKQVFTGDASQLQREYEKLAKSVATLEGKMGQAAKASERAASAAEDAFDGMDTNLESAVRGVVSLAAGYLSLEAVIAGVNATVQDNIALQTKAFEVKSALGKSQATLAVNTLSVEELQRAAPEIEKIAKEEGFPETGKLTEATAEAISAAGGDLELALRGIRTVAGLARITPEVLRPLTGATIDTARASGASTDEAAALVLSAGKTGRVVDPRQQADVLGKGIGGIVASSRGERRTSAEQAAELIAALTVSMGDKMGDRSTTAAMSLSGQLDKFFSEGYEVELGGKKFKRKPAQDPGGVLDRVAALQQDRKLRDQFLKTAHFEAGAESIIKRIIREPEGQEARTLADARKTVGYDTGVLDQVKRSLEAGTPALKSADTQTKIAAAVESSQLASPDALFGEAREMRDKLMTQFQRHASTSKYNPAGGDWLGSGASDITSTILPGRGSQVSWFAHAKSMAEERLQNIDRRRDWFGQPLPGLGKKTEAELTEQDRIDREALKLMVRRFDELIELYRNAGEKQTQAIREQTQVIQQGQRNERNDSPPSPLIPSDAARGMRGVSRER